MGMGPGWDWLCLRISWFNIVAQWTDGYGGFHKFGYPKRVGLQWKIPLKWMRTGGTPILGNRHMMLERRGDEKKSGTMTV